MQKHSMKTNLRTLMNVNEQYESHKSSSQCLMFINVLNKLFRSKLFHTFKQKITTL